MPSELRVPQMGESISEATVLMWLKREGETFAAGEDLVELETDKATVELPAGKSGTLKIVAQKGQTVNVGDVIGKIDPAGKKGAESAAAASRRHGR